MTARQKAGLGKQMKEREYLKVEAAEQAKEDKAMVEAISCQDRGRGPGRVRSAREAQGRDSRVDQAIRGTTQKRCD